MDVPLEIDREDWGGLYWESDMLGVVLWSDTTEQKAVIWCEDHGDLAFYRKIPDLDQAAPALDAGDLVQFELETENRLRLAVNPQLVAEASYPGLASQLGNQMADAAQEPDPATRVSAKIIPFGHRKSGNSTVPPLAASTGTF